MITNAGYRNNFCSQFIRILIYFGCFYMSLHHFPHMCSFLRALSYFPSSLSYLLISHKSNIKPLEGLLPNLLLQMDTLKNSVSPELGFAIGCLQNLFALGTVVFLRFLFHSPSYCQIRWQRIFRLTLSPNNALCSNAYFLTTVFFLTRVLEKNNMQIVTPKDGLKIFFSFAQQDLISIP